MAPEPVLIIGAGVAGLVLAQGLKHRSIPFQLFERDPSYSGKDQGYRFRCEAPGLEALEQTVSPEIWRLLEATHPKDSPPVMTLLDIRSGERKGEMNAAPTDTSERGQRCWPMDRPWFREVLYRGIENNVMFGKEFQSYTLEKDSTGRRLVRATFSDGSAYTGRLLVAADGVRSRVRRQFLPDVKQIDTDRMVLWGRTPFNQDLVQAMPKDAFSTHFAATIDNQHPTRSVLWAAIEFPAERNGLAPREDYVFFALSTEYAESVAGKNATLDGRMCWIEEVTKDWNPGMKTLFERMDKDGVVPLPVYSSVPDLPAWPIEPCITLLGDAIHAMAPTGGVGGRTAIEDARDLCLAIERSDAGAGGGDEWTKILGQYEEGMRARAKVSVEQSFRGAKMIWAGKDWWEYDATI